MQIAGSPGQLFYRALVKEHAQYTKSIFMQFPPSLSGFIYLYIKYLHLILIKNYHLFSSYIFPLPPYLALLLQSKKQSGFPALWEGQGPPPSFQVYEGEHQNKLGSNKASTCSRFKTQCHCPSLLSQPSLSNTFRESV